MVQLGPNAELSVPLADMDRLFPFLLVVDRELRIQHMGSSLERLLPEGQERVTLGQAFEFPRHADELLFDGLGADPMRCFVLKCRSRRELTLRGQFLRMGDLLVFAGAPRIGAEAMKSLGLVLSDFAPHDAIGDYLFLVQAQQSSLAEAARLSDELARVNSDLEARVHAEIAERVRVEGELRLAQRLEAVGQLAAGVAHEINTPIQYVSDSLYFLSTACKDLSGVLNRLNGVAERLRELGDDEAAAALDEAWEEADAEFVLEQSPKAVARALDGVDRVAEIVRAMKAFAHPGADEAQPEDLNAALANTLVVAKNEYKYVADVAMELGELGPVTCRLGELNQVFLNLVVNAAHAIGDVVQGTEGRGRIVLRTRAEPGFAVVEIEDSGGGIPTEIQEKIWDPFFTTKPVGKGTGQGLTIARSIVVKHGGALSFETVMGKGTTFVIRLPLASASDAKAEEAAAA